MLRRVCSFLLLSVVTASPAVYADDFDPPAGYYSTATGTGATLKSQLHNIIDGHTIRSYGDARSLLQITDEDPDDPDRMILVYDRVSIDVSAINPNGSIPGWDSAATWNREHTWPRSRGVDSSGPDNSDLHQLRPSFTDTNSDRASLNFGGAFGQSFGSVGGGFWYPGDADAGMIARQQFYMAVRYDGSDGSTTDLELANGNTGSANRLGDLSRMIEWHFAAPPDEFERGRNDKVFGFQNNRNPFIDHPEFAWSVLIDQANDSRITIDGETSDAGGATSLAVDLGRVFVGGAVPADQTVTLNKAGLDGTYYAVTAGGAATSSLSGRRNAFLSSTTDSVAFDVGLDASTSTPGQITGAVTIDNLDITTSGGAGRGANDGDDVIDLSLTVLDHATPSFSGASELMTLSHDFGAIDLGDDAVVFDFDLFNLATVAEFTAGLELTEVSGSGATDQLTTTLAPFGVESPLAGGESRAESASLLTDTAGDFAATYTLMFAEEDLPGAQTFELTLNLTGEVLDAGLAGDFSGDGVVDARDYATWREGIGAPPSAQDITDLSDWRGNYGAAQPAAASVPEPFSLALLFTALAGFYGRRC